jgi:hypothetical protein
VNNQSLPISWDLYGGWPARAIPTTVNTFSLDSIFRGLAVSAETVREG